MHLLLVQKMNDTEFRVVLSGFMNKVYSGILNFFMEIVTFTKLAIAMYMSICIYIVTYSFKVWHKLLLFTEMLVKEYLDVTT